MKRRGPGWLLRHRKDVSERSAAEKRRRARRKHSNLSSSDTLGRPNVIGRETGSSKPFLISSKPPSGARRGYV
jgi:hypothetical protein